MAKGNRRFLTTSSWLPQTKYSDIPKEPLSTDTSKEERPPFGLSIFWRIPLPLPKLLRQDTYEEGREWIRGALLCTCGAGAILALNIILTAIATAMGLSKLGGNFQAVDVYQGSCSVTGNWATGLHALINVLSTLLLAASNYVMQCLAAPSRADVDRAHRKHRWLDIGTFSVRNLSVLNNKQRILWGLLLVTSTPIHMVYNSVVYSTVSALDYAMLLVPDDLTSNEPLAAKDDNFERGFFKAVGTSAADIHAQIFNGTYENVSAQECLDAYNKEFNTDLDALIAVTNRHLFHNTTVLKGMTYPRYKIYELDTPFVTSSLYGYITASGKTTQELAQKQQFILKGLRFEYPSWKVTVPNPAMSSQEASFDLKNGWKLEEGFSTPPSEVWERDLRRLCEYLILDNPDGEELHEYLNTPENWIDRSWAANVTFEHGKEPVYPDQIGIGVGGLPLVSLPKTPISRCMIKRKRSLCQLTFSPAFAVVVIVSNMIKVACMYLTARTGRTHLLLTVGDAVSSFLATPDQTAKGQRKAMPPADGWTPPSLLPEPGQHEDYYAYCHVEYTTDVPTRKMFQGEGYSAPIGEFPVERRKQWYQAVTTKRWMVAFAFFAFCEIFSIVLFALAFNLVHKSLPAAWELGFGKFNGENKISSPGIIESTLSLVLLSNTPQLVLSILYFLCNGILTSMLAAAEYNDYAVRRRPLRVSWPKGQQRSTYYLSLPYRYSVPLLSISAALHWLLSQSIFFVNIVAYDVHNKPIPGEAVRGCGYSPFPMFIILMISAVILIIFYILSVRRFKSPMPLAAQKSASISAACHPPPDDCDAAMKPVMWGMLSQDESDADTLSEGPQPRRSETSHTYYTFTSKEVVDFSS